MIFLCLISTLSLFLPEKLPQLSNYPPPKWNIYEVLTHYFKKKELQKYYQL